MDFINNHFLLSFYGWIVYNIYLIWKAQQKFDSNNNGYSWKELALYFKINIWSILFTLTLVPILAGYAKEFWYFFKIIITHLIPGVNIIDLEFHNFLYLCIGIFVSILQYVVKKYTFSKIDQN